MAVTKNIVAVTGTYTDNQGNEKKRYTTIGRVIQTAKGESIKIDVIPLGWDGWAGLYEPKDQTSDANAIREKNQEKQQTRDSDFSDFESDDIPF